MRQRRHKKSAIGMQRTNWMVATVSVFVLALLVFYFEGSIASPPVAQGSSVHHERVLTEDLPPGCPVKPRFLEPKDVDSPERKGEIPDHVAEFDKKGIKLPKYPKSEVYMVSITSNNTYKRRIAQEHTFGRIFEIQYLTYDDFPLCVLCEDAEAVDECHCPSFRRKCKTNKDIFFHNPPGWWCSTRRQAYALKLTLDTWKEPEWPKWFHLLDDNTFINPISEMLLFHGLDPDVPYLIGDDWGGFPGGGPGKLFSRGLLKLLFGPPVVPVVTYHWPNGTHSVTVTSQIESCFRRWQGGDWCFFHGDWGIAECVKEVGVNLTDIGTETHGGFFSQVDHCCGKKGNWFNFREEWIANVVHRTHSAAMHISEKEMFDIFYDIIVPFYENLQKVL